METLVNTSRSPETPPSHVNIKEMTSESGDRRTARLGTPAPEPEQLACPRCDSTNTKFCYYNNYNLSQPRHFCKSCRRYWTRGGTLRNVPVGGGTRKSASSHKRSRTTSAEKAISASKGPSQTQDPVSVSASTVSGCLVNLNDSVLPETDSLSSWFSGQVGMGSGLLPLNANGLGLGPGLSDGLGVLDWPPMETVVGGGGNGGATVTGGDTWQMNEAPEADCFPWPDLSISTLGKGLT